MTRLVPLLLGGTAGLGLALVAAALCVLLLPLALVLAATEPWRGLRTPVPLPKPQVAPWCLLAYVRGALGEALVFGPKGRGARVVVLHRRGDAWWRKIARN